MSISTGKSSKPSYMFVFSDEQNSKLFREIALQQFHASIVQHPYAKDGRSRDLLRVLVTASGSLFFDLTMRDNLIQKAEELGGYYLPKI